MPRLPPQPSVIFLLWYNSPFSLTPCQHNFCCFCFLNILRYSFVLSGSFIASFDIMI
ncbi:hypothetical protein DW748_07955 [Ruminococcus sp. AM28-41]|nr:hypothetical protein DW061_15260 [Ruminococcus sp. AF42-9BH]RHT63929.1 hypothetical protein DW748_07955 [Ruminococcus sp. AM28-41]RHU87028.1 hypothetical protein DXC27_10115 [Ruminococcus sp. OM08-7]